MTWILQIVAAVLMADFFSGLAHWIEDSYFSPETPLLGETIARNVEHHRDPLAFVHHPWQFTIRSSLVSAVFLGVVFAALGLLGPVSLGALGIAVFANQVHRWAHMPAGNVPTVVRLLQRVKVLQSPEHHLRHHKEAKDSHYCVVTNLLNPVLDRIYFWRSLEVVIHVLSGRGRRADESVRAV